MSDELETTEKHKSSKNGRLKIYLGFAPGVGKTYTMLREARYLKKHGYEVVIGWLEDKERSDTSQLAENIEVIPPQMVEYRGKNFPELNYHEIIKRRPYLVLIDELAHRNVPGSEHEKRYEDIEAIRSQGIHIMTTLNIQHVQGVTEEAAKITGMPATEIVPDWVLNEADEIELVDVPPHILRQRLREGKIFSKDMVRTSTQAMFSANKLIALRELALLYVAQGVDEKLENYREQKGLFSTIHLQERILVCVNSPVTAARLIATGSNIAKNMLGELYVLYVLVDARLSDREAEFELVNHSECEPALENFKHLTEEKKGRFLVVKVPSKSNIADGIRAIIRKKKITQVVIGESGISRWREIVQGSIITKILEKTNHVDIFVAGNREGFGIKNTAHDGKRRKNLYSSVPAARGKLKIYIGASAGAGKTVAMLREAHELRKKGTDVVIGIIETHNRQETAEFLEDIEIIRLKDMLYRSVQMKELDVEAVIKRRPKVVLIDELAHTNVPGSKNIKRYQDIYDILAAGIDVISAVNIQHIESLNDVVEDLTGVTIRETIPDSVIARADQLVMIDISPDNLRNRLKEGKIYASEKIEQALNSFFKPENLQVLRELALREVAQDIEGNKRNGKGFKISTVGEKVLVCIQPRSTDERLIRRGFRIAQRIKADFDVLHVTDGHRLSMDEAQQLDLLKNLSERLGAAFHLTKIGSQRQLSPHLLQFINEHGITRVVLGQSARTRWAEITYGSIVNPILRNTKGLDILVVADPYCVEQKSK